MKDYGNGYVPPIVGQDTAGHPYSGGDKLVNLVGCDVCDGMYAVGAEAQHAQTSQHKNAK